MFNFLKCSQLMFGSRVLFGIAYKENQAGFQIFSRKYYHNFKVQISKENMIGSKGCTLSSMNAFIITHGMNVTIKQNGSFEVLQSWNVPSNNKDIEILYLTVSPDE